MVPTPDRLARPTMPANPTQADQGSQVYYMVCMTCHGDQGQGLTPELVKAWGLGDMGCWQSKCHAANHPPDGFTLPKTIPPVVGPIIPARFATALDLHNFIKENMPWQAPGSLSDEEYWQLTAFLVRANGVDPGRELLNEQRAARISLNPNSPSASILDVSGLNVWLGFGALIGLVSLGFLVKLVTTFLHHG